MSAPELLFVVSSLAVGGSESKIVRVANSLARTGRPPEIAYLNQPATLLDKVDPTVRVTHLARRGKYSPAALRRLVSLLDSGARTVVAVNMYPLLYVIPAARVLGARRLPVVALVNTAKSARDPAYVRYLYAPILRRCDRLVFGCEREMHAWTQGYGLPLKRSEYIYNGVDSEVFAPELFAPAGQRLRAELGIPRGATVLGGIGRLAREKGFDMLIEATARLSESGRECFLLLVGDGPERRNLEQLARDRQVAPNVVFLGLLRDVRPALAAMDVFALPSRAVETFSNAALEAMSMALPVVLSDIAGATEMVVDRDSGRIFPVEDLAALSGVLREIYDSPATRQRMGAAARLRTRTEFTLSAMVSRYQRLAVTTVAA